jgi:hypothetical protein
MGAGISSLTMIVGLFMLLTSGSLHTHSTYLELVLDQCNAKCIHRPVVVRGLCSWPASENDAHRIRLKERCPDALSIVYNLYKEADGQPCLKYDDGLDIIDGSCVEVQHKKEPIKLAGAKESPTPLLAKLRAKIRKKRTSRARTFSYSTGKLK